MLRKLLHLPFFAIVYLGLVGYRPVQESELTWNGPTGWTAFIIVLAVILVSAILLVLQSHQTPENTRRYHLDHATQPSDEHAGHVEEHVELVQPAETDQKVEEIGVAFAVGDPLPLEPDDLTRIEGIGPKINQLLNAAGIMNFAQLAQADVENLQEILRQAGPRYSMADPASWPEQARLAAAGDWEAFQALNDQLRGGR